MSESLEFGDYTSLGAGVSLMSLLIILLFACHPATISPKTLYLAKMITIYNICILCCYSYAGYGIYARLDQLESFSGINQDVSEDTDLTFYVYFGCICLCSHLVDIIYKIYRAGNRISCANYFHMSFYIILGIALDNNEVLDDGAFAFVLLCLLTQGISVYMYRLFATWGKCITPGSQISTAFQLTIFAVLIFHSSFNLYYSITSSSIQRGFFAGSVLLYSILMALAVMRLFFKSRSTSCCHNKPGNSDSNGEIQNENQDESV